MPLPRKSDSLAGRQAPPTPEAPYIHLAGLFALPRLLHLPELDCPHLKRRALLFTPASPRMPPRAKRICTQPGCNALADRTGRCSAHPKQAWADVTRRGSRQERGYGAAWDRVRLQVLQRDNYLCQCKDCSEAGLLLTASEVDHRIPKMDGGTDDPENLQAINRDCHKRKTQVEAARYRYRIGEKLFANPYPEWIEPASCNLTILFGPPGSGKSTYIEQHRKPWHQVIDLDQIMVEVTGLPLYQAPPSWLEHAMRIRNQRLGSLAKADRKITAWFATTSVRRQWWIDRLKPTASVVLNIPEAVCIERVMTDERRDKVRQSHLDSIRDWWAYEAGGQRQ